MKESKKTRVIGKAYSAPTPEELNGILDSNLEAIEKIGKGGDGRGL